MAVGNKTTYTILYVGIHTRHPVGFILPDIRHIARVIPETWRTHRDSQTDVTAENHGRDAGPLYTGVANIRSFSKLAGMIEKHIVIVALTADGEELSA